MNGGYFLLDHDGTPMWEAKLAHHMDSVAIAAWDDGRSCAPVGRMAWYHCIAADVCGDDREELILYDPWSPQIHVYTPHPLIPDAYRGYRPTPRQYNPRLMD